MRKKLGAIILIIATSSLLSGCINNEVGQGVLSEKVLFLEDSFRENKVSLEKELVLEEVQNEIIRFHVLANSDTEEDQSLKIKVRDKVIEEMYYRLSSITNIDEARKIMLESIDEVNKIAQEVIEENGYSYSVKSELSRENFPDKMYGDTLYPQGNYEAFRILIGDAEGQNWWCVMFPPLCFVDESKQAVKSDHSKENLEEVIGDNMDVKIEDEINATKEGVENKDSNKNKESSNKNENENEIKEKVKFKFKLLEFFKKN